MEMVRIGLVGEYSPDVKAHAAIPIALDMAGRAAGCEAQGEWLPTDLAEHLSTDELASYDAFWCVPGSPFASMEGALRAIRYARENEVPFLGTCGGFQHALIEYARNVLGLTEADHAESNPDAAMPLVSALTCSLRGVKANINLVEGSKIRAIYGKAQVVEEFNCNFGLNPDYRSLLEGGNLLITGYDDEGEARVIELEGHPFFIGTLYQPERQALAGIAHPLINAFVQAIVRARRASAIA